MCDFACNIVELICGLELIYLDNVYLIVPMRTFWGNLEPGLNPQSSATDRYNSVSSRVLIFVFDCAGRLCLLDLAIPDNAYLTF
jgi:hypothetical protein